MHPVAELFKKKEIYEIAVIDDYFDPPRREDDGNDQIESFWEEIEDNEPAIKEIEELCGYEIKETEDITDDVLTKMWDCRRKLKFSKGAFDTHIIPLKKEERDLAEFCNCLSEDYGINITCLGTRHSIDEAKYKLVFIDYYLGPADTQKLKEEAVRKSVSIAQAIKKKYEESPYGPIFVLISSLQVNEEVRNEFRDKAGIMGGMFYFIEKSVISDKLKLALELYSIVRALESSCAIERFMNSLFNSIEPTNKVFLKHFRGLSISDYAYIQKLSLEKEGHLFGDYVLGLFGEHFIRLLHDRLKESKATINAILLQDLPPSQFTPSLQLTEIYQSSVFEFVPEDASPKLGNVYIKDGDVYMIINAECDLVNSSTAGGRSVDPDLSILLITGKLVSHVSKDPKGTVPEIRIELFERLKGGKKEVFRIAWHANRVRTIRYADFDLTTEGYKLSCRLKLPYALKIQNAFAANLTRVGVPVAPPIYNPLKAELFCEGPEGKAVRLVELTDGAAHLFFTKNKDQCILKTEFIYECLTKVKDAIEMLEALAAKGLPPSEDKNKPNDIQKRKNILERLIANAGEYLKLLDLLPLPKVDGEHVHNSIYITRGKKHIEGKIYPSKEPCPLWLNFIDT